MASPFANAGLSNFGNESKYYSTPTEMPGWMQGIKDVGIVALKNAIGIPPSSSPSGKPVAPVTQIAPIGAAPNTTAIPITQDNLVHPEVELSAQTNPFLPQ
jgi:hypothetical protein